MLFALDQNFPLPIVRALADHIPIVQLRSVHEVDARLSTLDDWKLFLELGKRSFDGIVTCDGNLLAQPKEMVVLHQVGLTLVVAKSKGHNPVKATAVLLAHIENVARASKRGQPQIWTLQIGQTPAPKRAIDFLGSISKRQSVSIDELVHQHQLPDGELSYRS
jgi:hypothetical protein